MNSHLREIIDGIGGLTTDRSGWYESGPVKRRAPRPPPPTPVDEIRMRREAKARWQETVRQTAITAMKTGRGEAQALFAEYELEQAQAHHPPS